MGRVGSATPRPIYLPRKRPGTHCIGDYVSPRGQSGRLRKISPPPGFDQRTVQTSASRYTDCAVPAPFNVCWYFQISHAIFITLITENCIYQADVVCRPGHGQQTDWFYSRRGKDTFLFSTASRTVLGKTQPPIPWIPGAASPPFSAK
jgi:hypothetical protein